MNTPFFGASRTPAYLRNRSRTVTQDAARSTRLTPPRRLTRKMHSNGGPTTEDGCARAVPVLGRIGQPGECSNATRAPHARHAHGNEGATRRILECSDDVVTAPIEQAAYPSTASASRIWGVARRHQLAQALVDFLAPIVGDRLEHQRRAGSDRASALDVSETNSLPPPLLSRYRRRARWYSSRRRRAADALVGPTRDSAICASVKPTVSSSECHHFLHRAQISPA